MDIHLIIRKAAVLLVFIVLYELKSSIDKILSELRQTQEQNDDWHRLSAWYIISATIVIGYLYGGVSFDSFVVGLYAFSMRITYFPIRLNQKRKKKTFYLSDGWWDKIWEGNEVYYFITAFALVIWNIYFILFN